MDSPKTYNHTDISDATLWIGKEMMECGGSTKSVVQSMLAYTKREGIEKVGILVLPQSELVTLYDGDEFHTKMKHMGDMSPNFTKLRKIYLFATSPISQDFREFKKRIEEMEVPYKKLAPIAVPIGCAAFGHNIGCDLAGSLSVLLASLIGFYLKNKTAPLHLNSMFTNTLCSYVATMCAFFFAILFDSKTLLFAQSAATFFLIPGVQLINTFNDIIDGHYLNGAARWLRAIFLAFGIVFGIILAIVTQRGLSWNF